MAKRPRRRISRARKNFLLTRDQAAAYEFILKQAPAPDAEFPHVGTCTALVKKFGVKEGLHAYKALVTLKVFIPTKEREGRLKVVTVRRVHYKVVEDAKANVPPRAAKAAKKVAVKKCRTSETATPGTRATRQPDTIRNLIARIEAAHAELTNCDAILMKNGLVAVVVGGIVSIKRRD